MTILNRKRMGLVRWDTFNSSLLAADYILMPNDSTRIDTSENGKLKLKHGNTPIHVFLPINANVLYVINDYLPTDAFETGGLIVYKDSIQQSQLVEYIDDGVQTTYTHLAFVKNGNVYEGYASNDGINFELIGTVTINDAGLWGLILNGTSGSDMTINDLYLFIDRYIRFLSLSEGMKIELVDDQDTILFTKRLGADEVYADVDGFIIPRNVPVTVKIYNINDVLIGEQTINGLWPGDIWNYEDNHLNVYFKNILLSENVENIFGHVSGSSIEDFIEVENIHNFDIDVTVSVAIYNDEFGYQWVDIAKDNNDSPGEFSDSIEVTIKSHERIKVWIRVLKDSINIPPNNQFTYKFIVRFNF